MTRKLTASRFHRCQAKGLAKRKDDDLRVRDVLDRRKRGEDEKCLQRWEDWRSASDIVEAFEQDNEEKEGDEPNALMNWRRNFTWRKITTRTPSRVGVGGSRSCFSGGVVGLIVAVQYVVARDPAVVAAAVRVAHECWHGPEPDGTLVKVVWMGTGRDVSAGRWTGWAR